MIYTPSLSSPMSSAHWVCSAGAGNRKSLLLSQSADLATSLDFGETAAARPFCLCSGSKCVADHFAAHEFGCDAVDDKWRPCCRTGWSSRFLLSYLILDNPHATRRPVPCATS